MYRFAYSRVSSHGEIDLQEHQSKEMEKLEALAQEASLSLAKEPALALPHSHESLPFAK